MKALLRYRENYTRLVFAIALVCSVDSSTAQEFLPELRLGAMGVVSGNIGLADKKTASAVSDFSDSAVLLGARQQLFGSYRAQFVVGFQFPDAESQLGQVFYHHLFVKLSNQRNVFQIGRSRLDSNLMEFPTLRDDDALSTLRARFRMAKTLRTHSLEISSSLDAISRSAFVLTFTESTIQRLDDGKRALS